MDAICLSHGRGYGHYNGVAYMKIYEYQLALAESQYVAMPEGAEVLSIGLQNGIITIWVKVEPQNPSIAYAFYIAGTGGEVPNNTEFIGTVMQDRFVWYVFQGRST